MQAEDLVDLLLDGVVDVRDGLRDQLRRAVDLLRELLGVRLDDLVVLDLGRVGALALPLPEEGPEARCRSW
ncbi:hypothetical protein [Amycolatopsis nalaikhensis]|uniref:Uncharacterized protein n=1 Tax=Amycolatopsis nalaikhensis TaxID=715472 RepID=A0ABY8XSR8_9PSEU|nr:hypothetical protein [Amycolatopsis sp. 2-2]WIV58730.1 hypothetical protein QP939_08925 [Amycolatopsis sp. 2-2]